MNYITLYHGTTESSARKLLKDGWSPDHSGDFKGVNCGNGKYLYLTNSKENALWFAEQNGGNVVLEIKDIRIDNLIVDPEDGYYDSVQEELNNNRGFPAYLATTKPINNNQFKIALNKNKKRKMKP